MSVQTKPWYQSKTVWFNLLSGVSSVLATIVEKDWVAEHPEAIAVIGGVVAAINIALRFVTDKPVSKS